MFGNKPHERREHQRERAAFRYIGALERGDFEQVAAILRDAQRDPELARMLAQIDETFSAEMTRPLVHKEYAMTVLPITRPLPKRMPIGSISLFAAALLLIVGVLAALRIPTSIPPFNRDPDAQIGAVIPQDDEQQAQPTIAPTATPPPLMQQLPVTATPIPFMEVTLVPDPAVLGLRQSYVGADLCLMLPPNSEPSAILSRPVLGASPIASLPAEQPFGIVNYLFTEDAPHPYSDAAVWLNIVVQFDGAAIQGWMLANVPVVLVPCEAAIALSVGGVEIAPAAAPNLGAAELALTAQSGAQGIEATAQAGMLGVQATAQADMLALQGTVQALQQTLQASLPTATLVGQ